MPSSPEPFRFERDSVIWPEQVRGKNLVELTGHALARMKTRSVSRQDVLTILREATIEVPTEPGRTRLSWPKTSRTTIDVVFEERNDRILVITVIVNTRSLIRRSRR